MKNIYKEKCEGCGIKADGETMSYTQDSVRLCARCYAELTNPTPLRMAKRMAPRRDRR